MESWEPYELCLYLRLRYENNILKLKLPHIVMINYSISIWTIYVLFLSTKKYASMKDFNSKLLTKEIHQQAKHITQENPKKNAKSFVKLVKIVIPLPMNLCLMENVGLRIKYLMEMNLRHRTQLIFTRCIGNAVRFTKEISFHI